MILPTPSLRPERRHPVAVLEGESYVEVTLKATPDRVAGEGAQELARSFSDGGGVWLSVNSVVSSRRSAARDAIRS